MSRSTSRLGRFGGRSGHAMVEFALGSMLLVTVFTGTFQYGFIFYQYNLLVNAVNNGAHFGALQLYDTNTTAPSNTFKNAVKKMVVYGDPTGTNTTPVVKGLGIGNVNITIGSVGTGNTFMPTSVTVAITGYTINGVTGTYTLTGKPAVTYRFQGMYCPDSGVC